MAKKAEIVEVSFKPATGGIVSETRSKMRRGGQGGGPDWDYETESGVHPTLKHASEHLKATLGHHFAAAPKEQGSEPPEE
jgi:hypothetical protein